MILSRLFLREKSFLTYLYSPDNRIGYRIHRLQADSSIIDSSLHFAFVFEWKYNQCVKGFIHVALFNMLRNNGDGAGTGAAGGTGNQEKAIRIIKTLGCPEGIDDLIRIFPGNFGADFVDFSYSMSACFPSSDQDSMLIIGFNGG